jgi:dihydropteroate synthase
MLVMGILNVTPDSFADGGKHNNFETAVARGLEMIAEGVDIIDIGGESTRPGADRVSQAEEIARTIPVITELAKHGTPISIDTMRASTAEAAIRAGASIINVACFAACNKQFTCHSAAGGDFLAYHIVCLMDTLV